MHFFFTSVYLLLRIKKKQMEESITPFLRVMHHFFTYLFYEKVLVESKKPGGFLQTSAHQVTRAPHFHPSLGLSLAGMFRLLRVDKFITSGRD